MSFSDPIGDMLARIKNSQLRNYKKIQMPNSKFKVKIAEVLKNEGYIIDYKILSNDKISTLEINLKYNSILVNYFNFKILSFNYNAPSFSI